MTDQQQHPITPPEELVLEWLNNMRSDDCIGAYPPDMDLLLATQAAHWGADQQLQLDAEQINQAWQKGADQELEACCEWVEAYAECGYVLRAARRPKPLSLKEQGRKALQSIYNAVVMETGGRELDVLKEIVESLPD